MTQPGPPLPTNPELDRLLLEIHARLRQELYDEVTERLTRAKTLAPDHPAVLEAEGDLALAKRRYSQAMQLFKRAFDLDRSNARVEEKFATALVKMHEPEFRLDEIPDDVEDPFSYRKPRPPIASGILSFVIPGLGQLYNGDFLKGGVILFINLACWSSLIKVANLIIKAQAPSVTLATFLPALLGNFFNVLVVVLMVALWIYSVVDAVMVAQFMRRQRGW